MSFFSNFRLNEIQFSNENDKTPPDISNYLSSDINIRRYPSNLGTAGANHYILFEIFVRDNTNSDFKNEITNQDPVSYQITELLTQTRGGGSGSIANQASVRTDSSLSQPVVSGAKSQWNTRGNAVPGSGGSTYITGQRSVAMSNRVEQAKRDVNLSLPKLKKTREVIALYMPDAGLQFNYAHDYQTMSAQQALGNILLGAQALAAGSKQVSSFMEGGGYKTPLKQLSPFLAEALSKKVLGEQGSAIGLANFGIAINPSYEVVFNGTNLRQFSFDFMFYPRSEKEAEEVYRIIQAFKFHAAAEITKDTAGRYLLAPSAFDIKFMYNGHENPNIPKVSTCVCTSVNVDYAPNGFSTYEIHGDNTPGRGKTGTPVATRLTLGFTETTMITKELLRGTILNNSKFEGAF